MMFVHKHYLFREADNFPKAQVVGSCGLWGTVNLQGKNVIFMLKGQYCVYYPSNIFAGCAVLKN